MENKNNNLSEDGVSISLNNPAIQSTDSNFDLTKQNSSNCNIRQGKVISNAEKEIFLVSNDHGKMKEEFGHLGKS